MQAIYTEAVQLSRTLLTKLESKNNHGPAIDQQTKCTLSNMYIGDTLPNPKARFVKTLSVILIPFFS